MVGGAGRECGGWTKNHPCAYRSLEAHSSFQDSAEENWMTRLDLCLQQHSRLQLESAIFAVDCRLHLCCRLWQESAIFVFAADSGQSLPSSLQTLAGVCHLCLHCRLRSATAAPVPVARERDKPPAPQSWVPAAATQAKPPAHGPLQLWLAQAKLAQVLGACDQPEGGKPGSWACHRPYEKHHLIIEFKVIFPENGLLSPNELPLLEKVLPERKEVEETEELVEYYGPDGLTIMYPSRPGGTSTSSPLRLRPFESIGTLTDGRGEKAPHRGGPVNLDFTGQEVQRVRRATGRRWMRCFSMSSSSLLSILCRVSVAS
ncbi:hypothetical protein QTO34_014427 [Cnephaeus nilssonii]|uniref:Uncharacterized protein n=1 Tax=Cnephaeus nilssonii TaxID=3371016 RepID=A0AA40I7D9_CNENI|nr:hypothetical protein QTO34_014427 [Eptesicus nilssonii]